MLAERTIQYRIKTVAMNGNRKIADNKEEKPAPVDKRDYWDGRAQEFSQHAASTGYPEAFIELMQPHRDWTVLDMACGGGTIAIPLAKKVKSITAVDFSKQMLHTVEWRCRIGGIMNIQTIEGRWEDNWENLGIGIYDIAIASRSLISDDAKTLIIKLNKTARKAVYISTFVGTGPFDKQLFESTGRKLKMGPDYIYYYNLLYEMGIMANVSFIFEQHSNQWKSQEEALDGQKWMFRGITAEEEDKVRVYLRQHLVRVADDWRLPYPRQCCWAVMWWTKDKEARL